MVCGRCGKTRDEGVDLVTGWLHYGTAERPSVVGFVIDLSRHRFEACGSVGWLLGGGGGV